MKIKREVPMKRFSKCSFLMIIFFVLMASFVAQMSVVSAAETTVLRFAGSWPVNHHCTRGQEFYAKLVMEKTNKVKIQVYPASQLFSDKDMVRAVSTGAVEMGVLVPGFMTGQVPYMLANDLLYLFKDRNHNHRWVDSPEVGEILKQEFEKHGYHLIYWMDFGALGLASTKPIKTLEDFKGKRIRAAGEMLVEGLQTLGASPTVMGSGEVYTAIQRNTIDGAISGWASFYERKYYEVAKYLTDGKLPVGLLMVTINKKIWDGLPKDVQAIMMEAGKEAQAWGRKECEKEDNGVIDELKKKGMQLYVVPDKELDRWKAASTKACIDIFMKRVEDPQKGRRLLEIAEKLR
jgi:tripartite ATP-independent transporter DctP family solute receptor